jgi:vancomycin resistance protein YoaR
MPPRYVQKYGPMYRRRSGQTPSHNEAAPANSTPSPRIVGGGFTDWFVPSELTPQNGIIGVVIIAVVLALLAFLVPMLLPAREPRVAAGTTLQGVSMAGLTRAMLNEQIGKRYKQFLETPVTFVYRDRTWTPSASEIGVSINIRQTSNELLGISTGRGLSIQLQHLWAQWWGVLDVGPHIVINEAKLQRYLVSIAQDIDMPVQLPDISIDETGAVETTPAQNGRYLVINETIIDTLNALKTAQTMTVTVRTALLNSSSDDAALIQSSHDAKQFLSAPIVLRLNTQTWTWDRDTLLRLIMIDRSAERINVMPDRDAISNEIDKLAQSVDSGSVEPRVRINDGVATIVRPGQAGVRLNREASVQRIYDALFGNERVIDLPIEQVQPQLDEATIRTLQFNDILSTGRSSFAGSAAYRTTNIVAGAKHIDGVMIAPGALFSFNTEVGAIDESNGFVQGYAVVGQRSQLEWGGGVCQVSTSLFRAAFYAGLPIREWHAHPFYIKWYDEHAFPNAAGPGLDATIFTGQLDFQFINDTGHWMAIETTVDTKKQILDIQLRGTSTGRSVRVVGPKITSTTPAPTDPVYIDDASLPLGTIKQTDKAKDGMSVVVYRIVTVNGKEQPGEEFTSNFKPWHATYLRGTGTTPTPTP